jgi:cardiolipin synthase
LLEAGGEYAWFHPTRFRPFTRPWLNLRTHRKIVVVDGRIAFTGGINVSEGYASAGSSSGDDSRERRQEEANRAWRDTHIRIDGAAALDLQMIFLEDWLYGGTGNALHRRRDKELMRTPADIGRWFPQEPPDAPPPQGPWVQIIASGPDENIPAIHRYFFTAISSARRRIWLTTPYFVPDEPMMTALVTARARGVDVRLLLPRMGDSRFVTAAASTFAEEITNEGVGVWEYVPRMIHAKTIVIDDELSIVGTANIDNRSFRLNFEVMAAIYDAAVNRQLTQTFQEDLRHAERLHPGQVRQSFAARLLKSIARLAAPLL